ncbi:MAG: hypothetical protein LBO06_08115 [Bacteroidales bacterium]|jgi:hypothetical protein|nr:hypothetical protein [Bacteroidales bacterium]
MKNKIKNAAFLIAILLGRNAVCQMSISDVTHNSANITITNNDNAVALHVFTKIIDNDTIYFEDFSKFPRTLISTPFCAANIALNLPASYTSKSGCKAKNIYNSFGDTCSFTSNSNVRGEFITPILDLSKSNGSYEVKFHYKNKENSIHYIAIYYSADDNSYVRIDSLRLPKNRAADTIVQFTNGSSAARLKFVSVEGINIDNLLISYPPANTNTAIANSPFTMTNLYSLTNLSPQTKYYCYYEGANDTLSFTTLSKIKADSIAGITPTTATIHYSTTDFVSQRRLVVKKKSDSTTSFASDLLFSQITSANGDNKALEIYNGTGEDLSLDGYAVAFALYNSTGVHTRDTIFYFPQDDSIKSNSCIVLLELLRGFSTNNNGIFYKNTSLTSAAGLVTDGNDAIALLHNGDTIDIFGRFDTLGVSSTTGWQSPASTGGSIQTAKTTLIRKSFVNSGIRQNPDSTFVALPEQWSQIGSVSSIDSLTLSGFGTHIFDNAIGTFDNIALVANLNLTDNYFEIINLEEGSVYEAFLTSGTGEDSVASNILRFKTPVNTIRMANGTWNDGQWTKGEPTEKDNAVILAGQTLVIPDGYKARCRNLLIKDVHNETQANLVNEGVLQVGDSVFVEVALEGQSNDFDGWKMTGLPLNVASFASQEAISQCFLLSQNSDLFLWQESDTSANEYGKWISYNDQPTDLNDFFADGRGYLVTYNQDTTLTFSGLINDNPHYALLNNASLSAEPALSGWHLCSNPYPFALPVANLSMLNVSLPSVLNKHNSNFFPLTLADSIPPFAAFFVQVASSENNLTASKSTQTTDTAAFADMLTMKISCQEGFDQTTIAFCDNKTMTYDLQTDNRKLHGLALSPEIFTKYDDNLFSFNAIAIADTLTIDLDCLVKRAGNYTLTLDYQNGYGFGSIVLYDRENGERLTDFLTDTAYSFTWAAPTTREFQLKLTKGFSSLPTPEGIAQSIQIEQKGNEITVHSNAAIQSLTLTNLDSKIVNQVFNSNKIIIPATGLFLLTAKTGNATCNFKVKNF